MSKKCPGCGKSISFDGVKFCPECGYRFTQGVSGGVEFDWIKSILFIHDEKTGKSRISKAKLAGMIIFIGYIIAFLIQSGYFLRIGIFNFIAMAMSSFIGGLFYYCVCRGAGFIMRKIV